MSQAAAAAHDDHHYTSTGQSSWKVGFWTFIGSECLFFATLISTYMVYKGRSVVGPYPEQILDIPLTPSDLVATGDSVAGTVSLAWVDASNNEDGFTIQRQVDGGAWDERGQRERAS